MFRPSGARLVGNPIGTDATGTKPLGNARNGVLILSGSAPDPVGGSLVAVNVIAFNGGAGVAIGSDLLAAAGMLILARTR